MSTHNYLSWDTKKIGGIDAAGKTEAAEIDALYDKGYLATRVGKGVFTQTRSLRIDLEKFELSSENRRILRKTESIGLGLQALPLLLYDWQIAKLAKDFYSEKFGEGTFSANKAKELLTDPTKSTFNTLLAYKKNDPATLPVGYSICLKTATLLHYCYPFYNQDCSVENLGLGMMMKAVMWAQKAGLRFVYLGSYQRPADKYKLQFAGLEWFDGKKWQSDSAELKKTVA